MSTIKSRFCGIARVNTLIGGTDKMKFRIFAALFIIMAAVSPGMAQNVAPYKDPYRSPHQHPPRRYEQNLPPNYAPPQRPKPAPLAPWQILLNTSKDHVQQWRPKEAAPILVKTLGMIIKDRKVSISDKKRVCSILMGSIPPDWRPSPDMDRMPEPPFYTLPLNEQKRIFNMVPNDWLFPRKADLGGFLLTIKDYTKGLRILRQATIEGDWEQASFFFVNRSIPEELQSSTIRQWRQEAERIRNPYMWLAVLEMQRRTGRIADFLASFDPATNAVRRHPKELRQLAQMCDRMRWRAGIRKIEAISPSILAPENMKEALGVFNRALNDGDRIKANAAIRMIHRDYPEAFRHLSTSMHLQTMFRLGWRDMALSLVGDPARIIDLGTKELIIRESAFDKDDLNHWIREFNDPKNPRQSRNLIAGAARGNGPPVEPERIVAIMQCGLRYFPDDPMLTNVLSNAYSQAGYTNRVIDLTFGMLKNMDENEARRSGTISGLWSSTQYTDYFPEVKRRIWKMRKLLSQQDFVTIARQLEQNREPAEALKWFEMGRSIAPDDSTRLNGASLYTIDAYNLQLRCLVKLRKRAATDKILREAKKRYPDHPFENEVTNLRSSISAEAQARIDNEALTRQRMREGTPPQLSADDQLPYAYVMWIARLQVKNPGGTAVDWSQMPELKPGWRDGLDVSRKFFNQETNEVLPFVKWVRKVSDKNKYISDHAGNPAIESVYNGFIQMDEPALGAQYFLVAILTAPADTSELQVRKLISKYADQSWMNLSEEQKKELATILRRERIYPDAASAFKNASVDKELIKWTASLKGSSLSGTKRFFAGIFRGIGDFFSSTARTIGKGFSRASASISNLLHRKPPPDELSEAGALADLRRAETSVDKTNALARLSQSDQEEALSKIEAMMPQLLILNSDSDPPDGLVEGARTAYTAASKERTLAPRAAKVLHRAAGFSTSAMQNLAQYDAMVHFWAGEYELGVDALFHRTSWDFMEYRDAFSALACSEVPAPARTLIAVRLDRYLEAERTIPSKLLVSIESFDRFAEIRSISSEGLSMIARILTKCVGRTTTIIPRKLLDEEERWYRIVSEDPKMPGTVRNDWYKLIEATYHKAIREPGDGKALVMPLKRSLEYRVNTESYRKLDNLVKALDH